MSALAITKIALITLALSVTLLQLNSAQAAGKTWTSQADWSGWTKSQTALGSNNNLTLAPVNPVAEWEKVGIPETSNVQGMWGTSSSDIWAVGQSSSTGYQGGYIYHYNGTSWSEEVNRNAIYFSDIWGTSSSNIWAVGNSGMMHFDGSSWTSLSFPGENYQSLWGSSSSDIWAVGYNNTIRHYDGSSWNLVSGPATVSYIWDIWGFSSSDIWASVQLDASTSYLQTFLHYDGVSWTIEGSAGNNGNLWGTSSSDIWSAGGGTSILHYDGTSWTSQTNSALAATYSEAIWGFSPSDVYVSGFSSKISHYDGSSWSIIASDTVSNASHVAWGANTDDVWFGTTNAFLHKNTESGTLGVKSATLPNGGLYAGSSVVENNKMYLFGGSNSSSTYSDKILEYNPTTDTLTTKSAVLPSGRNFTSAASYNGKAYIFGGNTGSPTDQILEYDPATDTLTTKSAVLPSGRYGTSAAEYNGIIYIFGGYTGAATNQILAYNPTTDILTTETAVIPDRPFLGAGRYYTSAITVGDKIYVAGGHDGNFVDQILEYNPLADSASIKSASFWPNPRERMSVVNYNGKIYGFGGSNYSSEEIVQIKPDNEAIRYRPETFSSNRFGTSAGIINGKIYIIGGGDTSGTSLVNEIVEYNPDVPPASTYQSAGTASTTFDGQSGGSGASLYAWNTLTKSETLNGQAITYYVSTNDTGTPPTLPTPTNGNIPSNWTSNGWSAITFSGNNADLSSISSLQKKRYFYSAVYLATGDTSITPSLDSLSLDYEPISSTLTAPNGGESLIFNTSTTTPITWSDSGTTAVDHIHLQYSNNSGSTWSDITGATSLPNSTTSYNWTLPEIQSSTIRVKVILEDSSNTELASDTSDNDLTIWYDNLNPTLAITSPTTSSTYTTDNNNISLTGTASDTGGINAGLADTNPITYTVNGGTSQNASGSTSWSTSTISLTEGDNTIVVTATDKAGNTVTKSLTITYTPSTPSNNPSDSPTDSPTDTPNNTTNSPTTEDPTISIPNEPTWSITSSSNKLTLSWQWPDNTDNINLYCSTINNFSPGSNNLIAQISDKNIKSYVYNNLTNNITYYCKVVATNSSGESATTQKSATPHDTIPPAQITDLSAVYTNHTIILSWTSSQDSVEYKIYRSTTPNFSVENIEPLATIKDNQAKTYTDATVNNDQTYYYTITSLDNNDNESRPSNEVAVSTAILAPTTTNIGSITNVKTSDSCTYNTINFDPIQPNQTVIIYRSSTGKDKGIQIAEITTNKFVDDDISLNKSYYYTLFVKDNNTSNLSDPVSTSAIKTYCPVATNKISSTLNSLLSPISDSLPIFEPNTMVAALTTNSSKAIAIITPIIIALIPLTEGLTNIILNGTNLLKNNVMIDSIVSFLSPLRFLGIIPKKRKKYWGKVRDSQTNLPIANALVRLVSTEFSKTVDQVQTDEFGAYNFVIAKTGNYYLSISANTYKDQKVTEFSVDNIYETPSDLNIYLDKLNKSRFTQLINQAKIFISFSRILSLIRIPLLVLGSLLALYNLLSFKDSLSLAITGLYLIFWIIQLITNKIPKNYGLVIGEDNKPLPRSIVRLFSVEQDDNLKLVQTTVTDQLGRYKFNCKKGQYVIGVMSMGYEQIKSDPFKCKKTKPVTLNIHLKKTNSEENNNSNLKLATNS
jgi:fibronectin type 3 domain-containing protein